mmetsp:Transcript_48165/g.92080  ORF Transcript_48165/g.92080 Transcript_48165/m.92080 type:complete len:210 (+) Transcript_48165:132-761(+)
MDVMYICPQLLSTRPYLSQFISIHYSSQPSWSARRLKRLEDGEHSRHKQADDRQSFCYGLLLRRKRYWLKATQPALGFVLETAALGILFPNLPIFVLLLLPDGHGGLQLVDGPVHCLQGFTAVGGGNSDNHGWLSNLYHSRTVPNRHFDQVPFFQHLPAEFIKLLDGHRNVGLIFEPHNTFVIKIIARYTHESRDCASSRVSHKVYIAI